MFGKLLDLHILIFALTLGIVLFFGLFILRPLLSAASGEMRRIAELLSQVPKDIDVEAEVAGVISAAGGAHGGGSKVTPADAAAAAAPESGSVRGGVSMLLMSPSGAAHSARGGDT